MEAESLKQLKEKFDYLLREHVKYNDIYGKIIEDSRKGNQGNFGAWWDTKPELQYGWFLNMALGNALSSLSLIIRGKENKNGECGVKCVGCNGPQYYEKEKIWKCQVICECK